MTTTREQLTEVMARGFAPLEEYLISHPLAVEQKQMIRTFVDAIAKYRDYFRATGGRLERPRAPLALEAPPDPGPLNFRGRVQESHGGKYLTTAERDAFAKRGFTGPFNVLSRGEAASLRDFSLRMHDEHWQGQMLMGKEYAAQMKEAGLWTLEYSGRYQALRWEPLWNLFACDAIAHRVASLLGDDVLCWRTQYFDKMPGQRGSFWHQTDTFRELSKKQKLVPTEPVGHSVVNITVWIALTDSTPDNGCMRIMPGSFRDDRLERFSHLVAGDPIRFLSAVGEDDIEKFLSIIFFGPTLEKQRALFHMAEGACEGLFNGCEVVDLEMKAGDAFIFTSKNIHGSYPNSTSAARIATVGRYTPNHVKVMEGWQTDVMPGPRGDQEYSLEHAASFQVHGRDTYNHNRIRRAPGRIERDGR